MLQLLRTRKNDVSSHSQVNIIDTVECDCDAHLYFLQPLFCALQAGCSLEVIQILYDSYPSAILQHDCFGNLPLHYLFQQSTDHRILEYILNQNPALAIYKEPSLSGQTLLQRVFSPWMMLIASNNITYGTCPSRRRPHAQHRKGNNFFGNYRVISRSQLEADDDWKDKWTRLVLTLRAAYRHTIMIPRNHDDVGDGRHHPTLTNFPTIPELHLSLAYPCPPAIVCQFIEFYPEQAAIPMRMMTSRNYAPMKGSSSVDIETTSCDTSVPIETMSPLTFNDKNCDSTTSWSDNHPRNIPTDTLPLQFFLMQFRRASSSSSFSVPTSQIVFHPPSHSTVLRSLIYANPDALGIGIRRGNTRRSDHHPQQFTIHMAISAGIQWDDGLQDLVYADPYILEQVDEDDSSVGWSLLPFIHAAAAVAATVIVDVEATTNIFSSPSAPNDGLDTVYCLLRENPAVLAEYSK